ncbi:MAG: DUF2934 domain-containing protein [Verrucomicrobiota bacterium]|jgi:hypothetical protein
MKNQNPMQAKPGQDAIARRAYEIWKTAGCPAGRDVEHWLQAEEELQAGQRNAPRFVVSLGAEPRPGTARSAAPAEPAPQPAMSEGWKTKSRVIEGLRRAQVPK